MPVDVSVPLEHTEGDDAMPGRGRQRARRPRAAVLGLRASHGLAWAEIVADAESAQIGRVLRARRSERAALQWANAQGYRGVVYGGRLYRLKQSGSGAAARFGQVESFWWFLQRRLKAKGGIRRHHLGLYLAEYAWRYNHRRLTPGEQLRDLLTLVRRAQVEGVSLSPRQRARRVGK